MSGPQRVYLDNAATSWPKPASVYEAVDHWQRQVGAAYARGASRAADESRAVVHRARRGVAQLIGEEDPSRVVLTSSGTDSLNLAILGLLRDGDHVVTTVVEHNAVLRPINWLASGKTDVRLDATFVGCNRDGRVDPGEVIGAIRPETRLVALIHASNVTGAVQAIQQVGEACRAAGARLLVDASQTLGRWPLDVQATNADLIAAPGHKGLLGPLGTGVLWLRPGLEAEVDPIHHGGAASGGDLDHVPQSMPDKYESGNLNLPGIAGLAAGVDHVRAVTVSSVQEQLAQRRERLADGLADIPGVAVYGPRNPAEQAGVVSFSVEGYDPLAFGELLASAFGVECRAGLHCAPRLHQAIGTRERGGLVRFSPSPETTEAELDIAVEAVRALAGSPPT